MRFSKTEGPGNFWTSKGNSLPSVNPAAEPKPETFEESAARRVCHRRVKGIIMNREEKVEEIRKRARKNFLLGYNCGECVTEAVLSLVDTGLPPDVKKLATGFGGGVGLYGDTCGAIIGAVMAVSAVYGRASLPEGEDPKEVAMKSRKQLYENPGLYRIFNQIPNRIREKYGKTLCRELAANWVNDWLCRDHALWCREIITDSAGIAAELILAEKKELSEMKYGCNVENIEE